MKSVLGLRGEETVDDALFKAFSKRASLAWNSLEEERLFKIAKDYVKYKLKQKKQGDESLLNTSLLPEEKHLHKLLGVDVTKLEKEVEEFLKELFNNRQEMTEKEMEAALDEKCKNPKKLHSEATEDKRPAFGQLSLSEKRFYKDNLKSHLKKAIGKKRNQVGQTRLHISKKEAKNCLLRYFLNFRENKAEFDHWLVDKASSSLLHVEVKTYPQGPITKDGLLNAMESARHQHGLGDALFSNILGPAAKLSSGWTKINMVFFPNIPNREVFREQLKEPIDDVFLQYIVTRKELSDDQWLKDLCLGDTEASKEEYERLVAIIVGSAFVSHNSQTFDFQKETREVFDRIVGGESVGIGKLPGVLVLPEQFNHLEARHLGSVANTIFWNDDQEQLREDIEKGKSLVLCGDYGGGKTQFLVSAAQKAVQDDFKVFVVLANEQVVNGARSVLNVALKNRFRQMAEREGGGSVKVFSL